MVLWKFRHPIVSSICWSTLLAAKGENEYFCDSLTGFNRSCFGPFTGCFEVWELIQCEPAAFFFILVVPHEVSVDTQISDDVCSYFPTLHSLAFAGVIPSAAARWWISSCGDEIHSEGNL